MDTLAVKKVVVKFVEELQASLSSRNIRLTLSEPVVDMLVEKGYDSKMGARPLARKIDELIRVPLSKRILFDRLENCNLIAVMDTDQIKFVLDDGSALPTVSAEGYIVLNGSEPTV